MRTSRWGTGCSLIVQINEILPLLFTKWETHLPSGEQTGQYLIDLNYEQPVPHLLVCINIL